MTKNQLKAIIEEDQLLGLRRMRVGISKNTVVLLGECGIQSRFKAFKTLYKSTHPDKTIRRWNVKENKEKIQRWLEEILEPVAWQLGEET